jgi:excisionase family DNA binding protein
MRLMMKQKKDSSTCSEQTSLGQTILKKLSTIEDLLKRKDDKPLTFKDACSYLGYAPSYLYKLTYKNIVPHYKPTGKIIFFSKNELDEWIFKARSEKLEDSSETKNNDASAGLSIKDPNQIELKLDDHEKEKAETEIVIEFPLKSRRKK